MRGRAEGACDVPRTQEGPRSPTRGRREGSLEEGALLSLVCPPSPWLPEGVLVPHSPPLSPASVPTGWGLRAAGAPRAELAQGGHRSVGAVCSAWRLSVAGSITVRFPACESAAPFGLRLQSPPSGGEDLAVPLPQPQAGGPGRVEDAKDPHSMLVPGPGSRELGPSPARSLQDTKLPLP